MGQVEGHFAAFCRQLDSEYKLRRVGHDLVLKWKKEELSGIMGRLERMKGLINVALEMDHSCVLHVSKIGRAGELHSIRKLLEAIKESLDEAKDLSMYTKNDTHVRNYLVTIKSDLGDIKGNSDATFNNSGAIKEDTTFIKGRIRPIDSRVQAIEAGLDLDRIEGLSI